MSQTWIDKDAWVLAGIGGATADSPTTLSEVIAHCDALERQIIEEAEFTGAAGRLIAAGLIGTDGRAYWQTAAGRELYLARGRESKSLLKGLRALGDPPQAEPLVLPVAEFDLAAATYEAEARQAIDDILR
ncbi:hypothetical protein AB0J80_27985 [Actinoplanes sp. NPDC049548]|uniref:hypothetical protein n=1 Tax=Actinoplanes sp. NPDC049548 TaxID=3155152 RepID=UPI00341A69D6